MTVGIAATLEVSWEIEPKQCPQSIGVHR